VLTPAQLAKAFKLLDVDGDGAIDRDEFETWWRAQKEKHRAAVASGLVPSSPAAPTTPAPSPRGEQSL
jgi:Ca2+-binding EF-hand superfamily protein